MQTSHAKCGTFSVHGHRTGQATKLRPGGVSWLAAFILVAVPVPAFAEAGPGENIAIALSSNVVGSQAGQSRVVTGTVVAYTVSVTGPTKDRAPATSFAITDKVPENLSLFVGDLDQVGSGPAAFRDNDSGLKFIFAGLSNQDDSVEFSRDDGETFDYIPQADSDGFDANVTHIRLRPKGILQATKGDDERFSLHYRMKVK